MNRSEQPGFDEDFEPKMDAHEVGGLFDFIKAWFIFCAGLALMLLAGIIYVVFLLLTHFGVLA